MVFLGPDRGSRVRNFGRSAAWATPSTSAAMIARLGFGLIDGLVVVDQDVGLLHFWKCGQAAAWATPSTSAATVARFDLGFGLLDGLTA